MEMFNTHRRDLLGFEDYMDLRKPGFGGPKSAIAARDAKGKLIDKNPKLAQHRHVVERDPAFSHKVWDSTYKAMTHDLVYKQEGKKPFTYPDPYLTAYPTVEVGEIDESTKVVSFSRFINEAVDPNEEEWTPEDYPEDIYPEGKDETDYPTPYDDECIPLATSSPEIKEIEARLRRYEGSGKSDEYGMNPQEADYSTCCGAQIEETGSCSECGSDCTDTGSSWKEDEEYGMSPELSNDPANPLGLSKEEMDKFLKDLNG
jgi:hypothetical protein